MQVSYVLRIDDAVEFNRYHMKHSHQWRTVRITRRVLYSVLIGLNLLLLLAAVAQGKWSDLPLEPIIFTIFLIALMMLYPRLLLWCGRRNLPRGERAELLSMQKMTLTPTALVYESEFTNTSYQWSVIDHIDMTPDYLFIYYSLNTGYIVPRRAFSSEAAFRDFAEKATGLHQAAVAQKPTSTKLPGRVGSPDWKAGVAESFQPKEGNEHLRAESSGE